ncbi:MAG: arginase family protein [Betaproteobacteria bacterium]|nr:arginase family protein [Betaproteobacteria bacterium]
MSTIAQQMGPPYEGVPCFCRMPMCFDLNALEADVAVLGICLDTGTSNRSGARYGPRAIREASMLYSAGYVPKQGFFDIELGRPILATTRIVDCGDIPTLPTLMTETFDGITESIVSCISMLISI